MRGAVAPAQAAASKVVVRYNKMSVFLTCLTSLNVASMSLKAYLSEDFPWVPDKPSAPDVVTWTSNFTLFEAKALAIVRTFYTDEADARRLPTGFFHVPKYNFDVRIKDIALPSTPLSRDACASHFIETLPGASYMGDHLQSLLCALSASNATIESGACQRTLFFGVYVLPTCVSYVPQSASTGQLLLVSWMSSYSRWYSWAKFLWRVSLTVYLVVLLHRHYFRHVARLHFNLVHFGHEHHLAAQPAAEPPNHNPPNNPQPRQVAAAAYEIVLGDPTNLILVNPVVCTLLMLDFWASPDIVTIAVVRANQFDDLSTWFLACLYFSRLVWFAYGGLAVASALVKRYHGKVAVQALDATLIAVAVGLFSGPVMGSLAQTSFCRVFVWLLAIAVPSSAGDAINDGAPPVIMIGLSVAWASVGASFVLPLLHRQRRRHAPPTMAGASSIFRLDDTLLQNDCRVPVDVSTGNSTIILEHTPSQGRVITSADRRSDQGERVTGMKSQTKSQLRGSLAENVEYASLNHNDFKHRYLMRMLRSLGSLWSRVWAIVTHTKQTAFDPFHPLVPAVGGSIYALQAAQPAYIRHPTVTQRGTDCLVICYARDGNPLKRLRLSLLGNLDRQGTHPTLAIVDATESRATRCAMSIFHYDAKRDRVTLHRGANGSPWCV
ncbi:Aste57867_7304 [Aphanomyces stellatus]|uniref:Aste57867_7304 protein n=1 Tax=Aphanomyces stellatus TaxID=120398 RepID=A0A485KI44_9STRA|nr:hypothetical protein As57867_007278 [Aphanomyces stellatus]VFT84223.1 Aste57867_7304 [Aphanomyces stellatus]